MVPLVPRVDPALLKAIAHAHVWTELLVLGETVSIKELSDRVKQERGYVARVVRRAFLAPSIMAEIQEGRQCTGMTVLRIAIPFGASIRTEKCHNELSCRGAV
jgi:hypothetical protein